MKGTFYEMKHSRVLLSVGPLCLFVIGCTGTIDDPATYGFSEPLSAMAAARSADDAAVSDERVEQAAEPELDPIPAREPQQAVRSDSQSTLNPVSVTQAVTASAPLETLRARVGAGKLEQPLAGPGPLEAAKLSGEPYVLIKNWDFGKKGTIRDQRDLIEEFDFHDHWNTIANG